MRLLLDTCTFLWIVGDSPHLSARAKRLHAAVESDVYLSAVSCWEIAVKHALGRLKLPEPPHRFVPEMRDAHGIESLPLSETETLLLPRLPALHRDPFDRMLVCQAMHHGLTILTPDEAISPYPVPTIW